MVEPPEFGSGIEPHRALAAILCADVVGYTGLMSKDETATRSAFVACMTKVVEPAIKAYRGRVVKSTGDGFIAVFESVVDGTKCTIAIQEGITSNKNEESADRFPAFRLGLNIGDIIFEKDDVFGTGVNMAARLESLAEPNGICVSRAVRDELRGKLQLDFEPLGSRRVKSTDPSLEAFRLLNPMATGKPFAGPRSLLAFVPRFGRRIAFGALALAVALSLAGIAGWRFDVLPWGPMAGVVERQISPSLPLPDKPSIAVLAFNNISSDPDQEYFADGISEDIITDLARISGLFVIARNSSFAYKGKKIDIRTVGRELGVRYVLEGSVRKAGDTVRINAQLIDAQNGAHVWANRYDSRKHEIFNIQDEITAKIVTAMAINLTEVGRIRRSIAQTDNFAAYDAFLRGWAHFRRNTFADYHKAVAFYENAVELDRDFSQAYAAIAAAHLAARRYTWTNVQAYKSPEVSFLNAQKHQVELLQKARRQLVPALRNPTSLAYRVQAEILIIDAREKSSKSNYDEAIRVMRKAIELDPNDADNYAELGLSLIWNGRPENAFAPLKFAKRINPFHPALYDCYYGIAVFGLKQYQEATTWLNKCAAGNPNHHWPYIFLAASHAYLGQDEAKNNARIRLQELMKQQERTPFTVKEARSRIPYSRLKDTRHLMFGLLKAGLKNSLLEEH